MPPSLAHHFMHTTVLGGRSDKAIAYCVRAAKRAEKLVAYEEAAEHYERAIKAVALASAADERAHVGLLLASEKAR